MIYLSANWKMYKTITQGRNFIKELLQSSIIQSYDKSKICISIFPNFLLLSSLIELTRKTSINIGAQNVFHQKDGSYTGEISLPMLEHIHVSHVLIGHSERRINFYENDELIVQKTMASLEYGFNVTLCIGENLSQKNQNRTLAVIKRQIESVFKKIHVKYLPQIKIAYEPIWSIGTDKSAEISDIAAASHQIKNILSQMYCLPQSNFIVQYGGSINDENAYDILSTNVDGLLIGNKSLKPESFIRILKSCMKYTHT